MDNNANCIRQPNKEDIEHALIIQLASCLDVKVKAPVRNTSMRHTAAAAAVCGVTPPNTLAAARQQEPELTAGGSTENPQTSATATTRLVLSYDKTDGASAADNLEESTETSSKGGKSSNNEDEHTIIRDCVARLTREASLKKPTVAMAAGRLRGCSELRSPVISRSNRNHNDEHSLISYYTAELNKSPSSTPVTPRSVRLAERFEGRPGRPMDVEHALISGYSNSLATSKTSRRSSMELDIEATEEFYETQRKVFLQLQQKNIELRKKIAQMKASESPSTTRSPRGDSPQPPESSGNWSVSEYYKYTKSDETFSGSPPSPREGHDGGYVDVGPDSPVFHGEEGEEMNGDLNEKPFERTARLQMLKEKREKLTQLLKKLSDDATRPTCTAAEYEDSALSV